MNLQERVIYKDLKYIYEKKRIKRKVTNNQQL
jgi:hypothetical protein